jgi:hypothetical protein
MSTKWAEKCKVQVMVDEREYSEGGTWREVIRSVSHSWCRCSGGRERGDGSWNQRVWVSWCVTWPFSHASDCAKSAVELVEKHDSSITENVDVRTRGTQHSNPYPRLGGWGHAGRPENFFGPSNFPKVFGQRYQILALRLDIKTQKCENLT